MFENIKYRYPIAVDMNNNTLCAVQLKKTKKGLGVNEVIYRELHEDIGSPFDEAEAWINIFKTISKNKHFSGKTAAIHLPLENVFNFPIRFHLSKEEALESAILREAGEYLPFPVSEAVIDYPSIYAVQNGGQKEYKATVTAARMADIRQFISLMKQAGLSLETVDVPVSSLVRLHEYLNGKDKKPVVLCHVGRKVTFLVVTSREGILGERIIPWGMDNLYRKVQSNLEFKDNSNMPRILLRNYGLSYETSKDSNESSKTGGLAGNDEIERTLYQILTPLIETLVDEIHKIIGYVRSEEPKTVFEGCFIYGEGTLVNGLDNYCEHRLGMPTRLIDPMSHESLYLNGIPLDKSDSVSYALPLGLAMRKVAWL